MAPGPTPLEFARPIDTTRLPRDEAVYDIAATPAERAALARRFDLVALDRLEAQVRLYRVPGGLIRLAADLSADVVQSCVVTLEPVAGRVDDRFTLLYGALEAGEEVVIDNEAELMEALSGGVIDIGEAVAQQLSLALDPYPRAAGVTAAETTETVLGEGTGESVEADVAGTPASPFAALARWRKNN